MLPEALAALASAGSAAVVTAMATDGWETAKHGFARLLGRGDRARIASLEEQLDRDRAALTGLTAGQLERAQEISEADWRARLTDLLEAIPEIEAELRAWLASVGRSTPSVTQHVTARDNARVFTLGNGVQNINLADRNRD